MKINWLTNSVLRTNFHMSLTGRFQSPKFHTNIKFSCVCYTAPGFSPHQDVRYPLSLCLARSIKPVYTIFVTLPAISVIGWVIIITAGCDTLYMKSKSTNGILNEINDTPVCTVLIPQSKKWDLQWNWLINENAKQYFKNYRCSYKYFGKYARTKQSKKLEFFSSSIPL